MRQMVFSLGVSVLVEVLRELGGLSGSGLADDDDDAVVADDVEQLLADGEDGQVLPLLLDALLLRELGLLLLVNLNVQGKVGEFLIVDISTSRILRLLIRLMRKLFWQLGFMKNS